MNLAGSKGSQTAMEVLKLLEDIMLPSQIAEAQRMAREWMAKHPQ